MPIGTNKLTNKSGGTVDQYRVVVLDTSNDSSFTTTTTERDNGVVGVVDENGGISSDSLGIVVNFGIVNVEVTGSVSRGDWLITSTTAGKAKSGGTTDSSNSFGIALEAGTDTTVKSLIVPIHPELSTLSDGSSTDDTIRWDGSAWVSNSNFTADSSGNITPESVNLGDEKEIIYGTGDDIKIRWNNSSSVLEIRDSSNTVIATIDSTGNTTVNSLYTGSGQGVYVGGVSSWHILHAIGPNNLEFKNPAGNVVSFLSNTGFNMGSGFDFTTLGTVNAGDVLTGKLTGNMDLDGDLAIGTGTNKTQRVATLMPGANLLPALTNGCSAAAVHEVSASDGYIAMDFPNTAARFAIGTFVLPEDFDGSNVTASVYWTATSGSGTVNMDIWMRAREDDTPLIASPVFVTDIVDTLHAANDLHVVTTPAAAILGGSGPDLVQFRIRRNPSEDTLSADMKLIAVTIDYA